MSTETRTNQTDYPAILEAHWERQAKKKAVAERNSDTLFDALAQVNITAIEVEFDGAGDSGQIEQITPYREDAICDWPTCTIHLQDLDMDGGDVLISSSVEQAIETLCYNILEDREGGWENNDGAFGTFSFDVANRKITLDFNSRFTGFEHTEYHIAAGEI